MADQTDEQTEDSQQRTKRQLRLATESLRDRSEKRRISESQPKGNSLSSFWWGFSWPLRQLGHGLRWFNRFRIIRLLGRIIFPRYFRDSWHELRLVTWPNRRQSWRLTYAVIIFSVIFGGLVAIVDYGLDKLFKELILK